MVHNNVYHQKYVSDNFSSKVIVFSQHMEVHVKPAFPLRNKDRSVHVFIPLFLSVYSILGHCILFLSLSLSLYHAILQFDMNRKWYFAAG